MPSSVNNLWDNFISFENIYRGYLMAAKKKRYHDNILFFKLKLEENLFSLINDLEGNSYAPLPIRQFWINDPKRRLISAPAFRDRVVHHSLVQIIEPIFERRFINEIFACRVGKGTHASMQHIFKCAKLAKRQWGDYYVLKGDIHEFFASLDHNIISQLVQRSIRDKRILYLINTIVKSYEEADGLGVPKGALTSQLFANIYLDPLDHFLKEGPSRIKYYARYMDDFVIIHQDKAFLHELLREIGTFLHERLAVELNPKTDIFPGKHAIDFCGYRIWPTHIKPRKRTVKRARRRLKKLARVYQTDPKSLEHAKASLMSFLGYVKHCSGRKTTLSLLRSVVFKGKKPALPDNAPQGQK